MNILQSVRIALRSIGANKMRSGLTMLGIIIGVMAVITMLSIGRGMQNTVTAQINSIGTNLLFIRPGNTQSGGVRQNEAAATLTLDDADALMSLPNVVSVAPQIDGMGQLAYLGNNTVGRIMGVTPEYLDTLNANVASGEFVSASQVTARSAVVVLGAGVATTLFDTADPVGQTVRINAQNFRVIGVMEAKGGTGFMNADTQIFVPITTAGSRLIGGNRFRGGNVVSTINVKITDTSVQDAVVQDISNVLRERHRIIFQDDFTIQSQQDILNTLNQITDAFTIFLGGIAGISLVVGGIGIMNIMLVSVTERTREIGLRKAVGARKRDIMIQFLTEATVLSLAGGIIGILFGALIAQIVSGINIGTTKLQTAVELDAIMLAVLFSAAVGLFFGSYPASRAAGLHPIDALRYE
ncbi:MAG: FtsX-like permease family protein [Chloroflexi bacterium]|nr:FtsX-like permease family protein [Chloroflexota bacterium]